MCPSEFARFGGIAFFALGLLGVLGVLGPTGGESLFKDIWWIDVTESALFLLLGALLFFASYSSPRIEHPVVLFISWFCILLSGWGLFAETLLTVHLERPVEVAFFFVIGVWGFFAGLCKDLGETDEAPPTL